MTDEPTTPAAERHQHGGTDAPECETCSKAAGYSCLRCGKLTLRCGDLRAQRDQFRAWYLEAADDVDDARRRLARVEAAIAPWPPGVRKGDVLRALGVES